MTTNTTQWGLSSVKEETTKTTISWVKETRTREVITTASYSLHSTIIDTPLIWTFTRQLPPNQKLHIWINLKELRKTFSKINTILIDHLIKHSFTEIMHSKWHHKQIEILDAIWVSNTNSLQLILVIEMKTKCISDQILHAKINSDKYMKVHSETNNFNMETPTHPFNTHAVDIKIALILSRIANPLQFTHKTYTRVRISVTPKIHPLRPQIYTLQVANNQNIYLQILRNHLILRCHLKTNHLRNI